MKYKNRWNKSLPFDVRVDYFWGSITEINYKGSYEQLIALCFYIWMPVTWMCSVSEKSECCTFTCTFCIPDFGETLSKIKRTERSLTSSLFLPLIKLYVVSLICYIGNKMEVINGGGCREVQILGVVLHDLYIIYSSEIPSLWYIFLPHGWNYWAVDFLLNSKCILTTKALGRTMELHWKHYLL